MLQSVIFTMFHNVSLVKLLSPQIKLIQIKLNCHDLRGWENCCLSVINNFSHSFTWAMWQCHTQNRSVTSTLDVGKKIWQLTRLSVPHLVKKPLPVHVVWEAYISPDFTAFPGHQSCFLTAKFWSLEVRLKHTFLTWDTGLYKEPVGLCTSASNT